MDRQLLMLRMVASYDTLETASSIHLFTRIIYRIETDHCYKKQANRVKYLIVLVVRYFLTITARKSNQDIVKMISWSNMILTAAILANNTNLT